MDAIKKEIDRIIDNWTQEIIKDIINQKVKPRGVFDRIKGGLSNLFYGRNNEKNPYYFMNKFGDDLGRKEESFNPRAFTLREYMVLKNEVEKLEFEINENINPEMEKIKIVRMLKQYADELKTKIYNLFIASIKPDLTDKPAQTADKPAQPADKPVKAKSDKPVQPADKSVKAKSDKPVQPADKPVKAKSDKPAQPADKPVKAKSDKPVQPADKPVKAKSDKPAQPADKPVKAKSDKPVQITKAKEKELENTEDNLGKSIEEEKEILISKLYENKSKEQVIKSIGKLIKKIHKKISQKEKQKFGEWWVNHFKEKLENQDLEHLISSIKTSSIFKTINSNLEKDSKMSEKDFLELLK